MNIFLIGYRCTGKTTAGKLLAESMGWPFVDADVQLVEEQGTSIKDIVDQHGWDKFREIEKSVIKKLSILDKHVVASGGGAVLDKENVENMKKNGKLVWLCATSDTIKKRILQDAKTEENRPSLTDKGLLEEIEETLNIRNPLYEKAMDFSVDTDGLDIDTICKKIKGQLQE